MNCDVRLMWMTLHYIMMRTKEMLGFKRVTICTLATSHSLSLNTGYETDVIGKTISQTMAMAEHFSTGSHAIMCIFLKLFSTRQRPSNPLDPTDNVSFQILNSSFKKILKIFLQKESFEQNPLCIKQGP